jgi:hypothetical protein
LLGLTVSAVAASGATQRLGQVESMDRRHGRVGSTRRGRGRSPPSRGPDRWTVAGSPRHPPPRGRQLYQRAELSRPPAVITTHSPQSTAWRTRPARMPGIYQSRGERRRSWPPPDRQ